MKGTFIVFEGLDGCGKGVQTRKLKEHLESKGHTVVLTHEPTYTTEAAKKIKDALTHKIKLPTIDLQKLYVEDRREHVRDVIQPALDKGHTVIGDRYYYSTCAFSILGNIPVEDPIEWNSSFPKPDIAFLFKVRPEICLERIGKRGEGFELHDTVEKMNRVWEAYEKLPNYFPELKIVNGEGVIEEVWNNVLTVSQGKI